MLACLLRVSFLLPTTQQLYTYYNTIAERMAFPSTAKLLPYQRARATFVHWHEQRYGRPAVQGHSIEHVVPQSALKRAGRACAIGDMHNFMLYPLRLNRARGTRQLVDAHPPPSARGAPRVACRRTGQDKVIRSAADLDDACLVPRGAQGGFYPARTMRGAIARCAGYMMVAYPAMADVIAREVLDARTLVFWHHQVPISSWELELDLRIASVQGVRNPLIAEPGSIHQLLLGPAPSGKAQLELFEGFDYDGHYCEDGLFDNRSDDGRF